METNKWIQKVTIELTLLDCMIIIDGLHLALRHPANHGHSSSSTKRLAKNFVYVVKQEGMKIHEDVENVWNETFDG